MINKEEMVNIFKNSLPKTTIELIGSNIYPNDIPKMIKVSPLSMQDEKRILTQDYKGNYYKMILNIVEQGITVPIDIDKLYLFDIDYIFNVIRVQTHGSIVNIEQTCPHCKKKNNISFDLSVVDINKPKKIEDISSDITINNISLSLSIPTVEKNNYVNDLITDNNFINELKKIQEENKVISPKSITKSTLNDLGLIFTYINKFNGEIVESKEDYIYIILYILSLKSDQLIEIRNGILEIKKVFNIEHKYKCVNCNKDIKLSIADLGSEYFFPSKLS